MKICTCGEEFTESKNSTHLIFYCQRCGAEETEKLESRRQPDNLVSITRANILKQVHSKVTEQPKKPKQIRDRTDYTKARRAR